MREAMVRCWVFRMRKQGRRLATRHVGEPTPGDLLPMDRYGEPDRFYLRLCPPGRCDDWIDELHCLRRRDRPNRRASCAAP